MWITVLILALLGVWVFFAVRAVKKGKARCGGDCASCPHRSACP
jgi:hypothetical protein